MDRRTMIKSLGGIPLAGMLSCQAGHSYPVAEITTDVLVIGGGTAGVIAAIQAARAGCRTLLVENGSQLGGTMTTGGVIFPGLFHAWGKQVIAGIGWELVNETVELNDGQLPDFSIPFGRRHPLHQVLINGYLYAMLAEEKCRQAGVTLHYYETPVRMEQQGDFWLTELVGKGSHHVVKSSQVIDCTGNAFATSLAGYPILKEAEIQPGSLIFELEGYDLDQLDWQELSQRYQEALKKGDLLKTDAYHGIEGLLRVKNGLATQHVMNADSTTSLSHTRANLDGRESLLRILRFVRTLPGCENARIKKMQPETAIRETARIDGIYQITHEDYVEGRIFEDSLSYSYYPIDLHVKEGVTPKHLTEGVVATVPLRALIPKGSRNFIVAGRCVSSDRLANSALRVQASCMGMGQAAGAVAALAYQQGSTPMEIPLDDIRQLIGKHEGIVPN